MLITGNVAIPYHNVSSLQTGPTNAPVSLYDLYDRMHATPQAMYTQPWITVDGSYDVFALRGRLDRQVIINMLTINEIYLDV